MPPKAKFTKEELVSAALSLIREGGMKALTARALGERLGTSSRPIFTLYRSMTELQQDIIVAAYALYHEYIAAETATGRYPPYKAAGMAYIRFAVEEKELFTLLFMRERESEEIAADFCDPIIIDRILQANHLTRPQAEQLYLRMWFCVHGIATMLVTSYFTMEWDTISEQLTAVYLANRDYIQSQGGTP